MLCHTTDADHRDAAGDFLAHRQLIVDLVGKCNLIAMCPYRDYVELGGLDDVCPRTRPPSRGLCPTTPPIRNAAGCVFIWTWVAVPQSSVEDTAGLRIGLEVRNEPRRG